MKPQEFLKYLENKIKTEITPCDIVLFFDNCKKIQFTSSTIFSTKAMNRISIFIEEEKLKFENSSLDTFNKQIKSFGLKLNFNCDPYNRFIKIVSILQENEIDEYILFCLEKRLKKLLDNCGSSFTCLKSCYLYRFDKSYFFDKLMKYYIETNYKFIKKDVLTVCYNYRRCEIIIVTLNKNIQFHIRQNSSQSATPAKFIINNSSNPEKFIRKLQKNESNQVIYLPIHSNTVAKAFRHYNAIRYLKRSILVKNAIERWRHSLWKPYGALSKLGWELCNNAYI